MLLIFFLLKSLSYFNYYTMQFQIRYCTNLAKSSWCQFLEKKIVELKKAQRRATKIIPLLRNYEYNKRHQLIKNTTIPTKIINFIH